jgi:hypothetical protein
MGIVITKKRKPPPAPINPRPFWEGNAEMVEWDEVIRPDVLLPSQLAPHFELTPEQELNKQLLFDAIADLQHSYKSNRHIARRLNIISWIKGGAAELTFNMVTAFLGMDSELARKWVLDLCESWELTNGVIPDLSMPRHPYFSPEPNKPTPVFTERFITEYWLPCFRFKNRLRSKSGGKANVQTT